MLPNRPPNAPQLPQFQAKSVSFARLVLALSRALDMATGQKPGHDARGCYIGMHIAIEMKLERFPKSVKRFSE